MTMSRRQSRPRIALSDGHGPALALGRCHEIAGPLRHGFAAYVAGRATGSVLWITAVPGAGRLHPQGLHGLLDPARLVFLRIVTPVEALWAAEEALRSGAVGCVVLETATPPALTPVRRLNLAAAAVGDDARPMPLCLLLLPQGGAAGAVETRWLVDHPVGAESPGVLSWRADLLRDKGGPPGAWLMRRGKQGMRVTPAPVGA